MSTRWIAHCLPAARLAIAIATATVIVIAIASAGPSDVLARSSGDEDRALVTVGSKRFTESYIIAEIVREQLARHGIEARHQQGLGSLSILQQALADASIDLYPEYTGTIVREVLRRGTGLERSPTLDELNDWLAPRGLKVAIPLGFDNSYGLAMREDDATRLGINSISALAATTERLRFALSHEFMVRADGWEALKKAYALPFSPSSGLDHGLAYQALARGQVDIVDVYTTDAQIAQLGLRVLEDDRGFFPRYDAVLLMRAGFDPAPLRALQGRIDTRTMQMLNGQVEVDGRSFRDVARAFLDAQPELAVPAPHEVASAGERFIERLFAPDLARLVAEHLALVFGALALAIGVGVPLGVWAHRRPRHAGLIFGAVGALQPIPSLALLAFLVVIVGTIGFVPALIAIFVYALLPIVRNTHAGLAEVGQGMGEAGLALGLRPGQVMRLIELPIALPTILAGVKTAAVLNVGTATIATFIGAGGLGERIVAGLAVNDAAYMMAGAVPATLLALLTQWAFDAAERRLRRRREKRVR